MIFPSLHYVLNGHVSSSNQHPPVPPDISVSVRQGMDKVVSGNDIDEISHHSSSASNVIINQLSNAPPTHTDVNSVPESVNAMMDEVETISVVSSMIDMDDNLTIDTFPQHDGRSLYSLVSPPLVMRPFEKNEDDEDDNGEEDNRSAASMDNTEGIEIFQTKEEVRQMYPLALLPGRGGSNQHDPNVQVYMAESRILQPSYQAASTHTEKWRVERQLIDTMEQQGRVFIQRNVDGTFQLMSEAKKREKVQKRLYVNPRRNVNVPLPPPVPQAPPPHVLQPLVPSQPPPVPQPAHVPQPQVLPPPPPPPPVLQPLVPPIPPDLASQPSKMEDNDLESMKSNLGDNDVLILPPPSFHWGIDYLDNPQPVSQLPPLVLPDVDSHWLDDNMSVLTNDSYHLDMDFVLDDPPLFPLNAFPIAPLPLSDPPQVPQGLLMEDDDSVAMLLYSFLSDINFLDD